MREQVKKRFRSPLMTVGGMVLAIGILYWAREILIPLALALLLTFILAPIVNAMRRLGLGKKTSVLLTVLFTASLVCGIGALIATEFRSLANELPAYQKNIHKKVSDLHLAMRTGTAKKVQNALEDVMKEFEKDESAGNTNAAVPVVVKNQKASLNGAFLTALLEPAARAGLVFVLVVFMLIRREDLRDRFLSLIASGHLPEATRAVNESGAHVSRYLLRQFLVNTTFGTSISIGLWFIGLPYALLWGFIAGVCRFIPYAGPVLGLASPIILSLAVFDSWTAPLLVVGLVACLELITSMWIEPILYGEGIGVSEVALLVMVAFWTWLWGGVGLILAAPMTVCLMVVSKSIPRLQFIPLLLSRSPPVDTRRIFYQRLLAKHEPEANDILKTFSEKHSRAALFEDFLLPTLITFQRDHNQHKVNDQDAKFITEFIRKAIGNLEASNESEAASPNGNGENVAEAKVWCVATYQEADDLPLLMLRDLFRTRGCPIRILSADELSAAARDAARPSVICVGFLPGQSFETTRDLCQQLRKQYPESPIVIGRWHGRNRRRTRTRFALLKVEFAWSLRETARLILKHLPPGSVPDRGKPEPISSQNQTEKKTALVEQHV
jgi:predicted PurR-regulated permease PerM